MRYVFLTIVSLLSVFFADCVFPQYAIFGVQPDIMLIVMLSLLMVERTLVPVVFVTVSAVLSDILFAQAIGFYSLPYAVVGLSAYLFLRRRRFSYTYARYFMPPILGVICFVLREILSAIISTLMKNVFSFGQIFIQHILPGILINGILMFLVFQLFYWLYRRFHVLRPSRAFGGEEDLL